ncbi:MAG: nickel transporter [Gammaproteobacteria bacterium PRO9]|nr:nickel transporter [Gammaproteobacteria bacterium PRO9]
MDASPDSLLALGLIAAALGMRHGLDADHLAAIDGLARFNSNRNPRLARWSGACFALGHGVIVITIAGTLSALASRWQAPTALVSIGAWISIAFLTVLGLANLVAAVRTERNVVVQPVGLRSRLFGGLLGAGSPGRIAAIGALFAISFDTVSQAALFAVLPAKFAGIGATLLLALLFTLGMALVDGLNGFWVSRLLGRTDRLAAIASRIMSFTVAALSLGVAGIGVLEMYSSTVRDWSEGRDLGFSIAIVVAVVASFVLATFIGRHGNRDSSALPDLE